MLRKTSAMERRLEFGLIKSIIQQILKMVEFSYHMGRVI